ncbi:hypothetical protein C1646_668209 [Rhizophagus diaphanus]|nr:hypothetical protein C1646_668209 [Rhizophagus diaphanus] [Rhizophagus sp. MUCL 43196]
MTLNRTPLTYKIDHPSNIDLELNWKHMGFVALLKQIHKKGIKKVVVTQKDQLYHFGFKLMELIFEKNGIQLMIFGTDQDIMDYALLQTEEDKKLSKPKRSKFPRFQQARHTVSTQEEQLKLRKWNSPMDLQPMSYCSQKKGHQQKRSAGKCLNAKNFKNTKNTEFKWVLKTPYDICDEAMNDLLKVHLSKFAAKK